MSVLGKRKGFSNPGALGRETFPPKMRFKKKQKKTGSTMTVQKVKRIISGQKEKKFFIHSDRTTATSSYFQVFLTDVPQGDTDSTRDGDQLYARSLELNFETFIQGIGGTNDFSNNVRVIVYQYLPMSDGTHPTNTGTDILQSPTIGASIPNWLSGYNHDNRFNFRILFDKLIPLSGNGPANYAEKVMITQIPQCKIQYNAGASVNGSGMIYLAFYSDSLVATHPAFNYWAKFNYNDG